PHPRDLHSFPTRRSSDLLDHSVGALMVKRVLMVAYHFPPMNLSSGIQRTLRFAQYLPEFNWEPVVLTAQPRAYFSVSPASLAERSEEHTSELQSRENLVC